MVVIGGSAGAIEALRRVLGALPADPDAALHLALHIPPQSGSALARVLEKSGDLPASFASDGTPIQRGHLVIAPPDHHLLVGEHDVRVVRGPPESGHRPALDPLFRSAALWHGPRVIAVVLSGSLDDGTSGAWAVRQMGGVVVCQDPTDARFAGMPARVIEQVGADHVVASEELAPLLLDLIDSPAGAAPEPPAELAREFAISAAPVPEQPPLGRPSPFACPDCDGVLWWVEEHEPAHLRCRIGHAWAGAALVDRKHGEVERALWSALRSLEERGELAARLTDRARDRGWPRSEERFRAEAAQGEHAAMVLRRLLAEMEGPPEDE